MIVLFHAVVCAVKDLSSPVWASERLPRGLFSVPWDSEVRLIVARAVEAIVDCSPD